MDLKYNDYYDLVMENGLNLKDVPNEFKTLNICLIAIKGNGLALEFVPIQFQTETICKLAVKQNPMALEFVPDGLKTLKICTIAIKNGESGFHSLKFINNNLLTEQLCITAIKKSVFAIKHIPNAYMTKVVKSYTQRKYSDIIDTLPIEIFTKIYGEE